MGCCFSTASPQPPPQTPTKHNGSSILSKSPPPTHPLLEEETVKEVLSETPTIPKQQENRQPPSPFVKAAPLLHDFAKPAYEKKLQSGGVFKKPFTASGNDDVTEEASEICSTNSETVSVSTNATEMRGNVGSRNQELHEIRQRSPGRYNHRSFSGEVKREKVVGRSPGRRPEPSPNRARPRTGAGSGRRKENGECSGRRSRSPATRVDTGQSKTDLGRSQSGRRTGKSPGRVGSGRRESRNVDGDNWPPTSSNNESLENPLVSLECFIFL